MLNILKSLAIIIFLNHVNASSIYEWWTKETLQGMADRLKLTLPFDMDLKYRPPGYLEAGGLMAADLSTETNNKLNAEFFAARKWEKEEQYDRAVTTYVRLANMFNLEATARLRQLCAPESRETHETTWLRPHGRLAGVFTIRYSSIEAAVQDCRMDEKIARRKAAEAASVLTHADAGTHDDHSDAESSISLPSSARKPSVDSENSDHGTSCDDVHVDVETEALDAPLLPGDAASVLRQRHIFKKTA